jgi:hypothetical protein
MRLRGHLVEVDWNGIVLDAHGTSAEGREFLNPGTDDGRLVLPAEDIDDVGFRDAPRMVGGVLLVVDTAGNEHRLHFRRGGREAFRLLFEELDATARANRARHLVVDLTEPTDSAELAVDADPRQDAAYDDSVSV